jgi:hypothetical protein
MNFRQKKSHPARKKFEGKIAPRAKNIWGEKSQVNNYEANDLHTSKKRQSIKNKILFCVSLKKS